MARCLFSHHSRSQRCCSPHRPVVVMQGCNEGRHDWTMARGGRPELAKRPHCLRTDALVRILQYGHECGRDSGVALNECPKPLKSARRGKSNLATCLKQNFRSRQGRVGNPLTIICPAPPDIRLLGHIMLIDQDRRECRHHRGMARRSLTHLAERVHDSVGFDSDRAKQLTLSADDLRPDQEFPNRIGVKIGVNRPRRSALDGTVVRNLNLISW
jgi:hypothetical protein